MKLIALFILRFYKKYLSPSLVLIFGNSCKYSPTCSEYSYQAINEYGIVRGGAMSIKRLFKCSPLTKGGFDPVPYSS